MEQIFPKRRHMKFRRRGITKKNEYNKYTFHIVKPRSRGLTEKMLQLSASV